MESETYLRGSLWRMNADNESKLFEAERKQTDDSLIAERDKATRSLSSANIKSQGQTDEIVKDERSIADQKTASSRASHDGRHQAESDSSFGIEDQTRLLEERERADLATGLERLRMDEAILAERSLASKLVAKVLDRERKATDHNLLVERNTTDANCEGSSVLLESEVAAHQKTKSSLTSREEFLAIVSHDLRNPIGAVCSYAKLILDGSGDTELGPTTLKFVEAIRRNADISLRLIADLLDLERISQAKLELKMTLASPVEIAASVLDIFRPQATERRVKFIFEKPKGDLVLDCDHDRILQVLTNLVGNALKYSPEDTSITISVRARESMIEFSVKDEGAGIPESKRAEIFKRFAQLASNDRTGLGLGLYIAKTLVEAHKGQIWLEPGTANGSIFHFTIPIVRHT